MTHPRKRTAEVAAAFRRRSASLGAVRRRRRQHSETEPEPSPTRESPRQPRRSQEPREPIDDSGDSWRCQRPERKACQERNAKGLGETGACFFEPVAVVDPRWANWLAPATAEAAVEMKGKRSVCDGEVAALERPHQLDAAAG